MAKYGKIEIIQGDITRIKVDAIVNAANTSLVGGGGVDGAIHRAAGPQLVKECAALNGCHTGDAKITKGYNLPAKCVIHTVGPFYRDGEQGEADLLARCYRRCFELAYEHNIKSIAFPAISTGAFRFPLQEATQIAIRTAKECLERYENIEKVVFVLFMWSIYEVYDEVLSRD